MEKLLDVESKLAEKEMKRLEKAKQDVVNCELAQQIRQKANDDFMRKITALRQKPSCSFYEPPVKVVRVGTRSFNKQ